MEFTFYPYFRAHRVANKENAYNFEIVDYTKRVTSLLIIYNTYSDLPRLGALVLLQIYLYSGVSD